MAISAADFVLQRGRFFSFQRGKINAVLKQMVCHSALLSKEGGFTVLCKFFETAKSAMQTDVVVNYPIKISQHVHAAARIVHV